MKNYTELEDKMHALSEQENAAPPAFVWDNIKKELDDKKDKRRMIIWFFFGISIISIGLLSNILFDGNTDSTASVTNNTILENTSPTIVYHNEETSIITEKTSENILLSDPSTSINNRGSDSTVNSLPNSKKDTKSFSLSVPEEGLPTGKSTIIIQNKIIETSDPTLFSEENNPLDINGKILPSTTYELLSITDIDAITPLMEIDMRSLPTKEITCPDFKTRKKMSFFIEANGQLGIHNKNLSTENLSNLVATRNNTESSLPGYGASILGGLQLTKNIYLISGIEWFNAREKFHKEQRGLTKMIVDYDITSGLPTDTSFVTGTLVNHGITSYKTIDIPLLVGINKSINSLNFAFEIGAIYNLNHTVSGKIITQQGKVSKVQDETPIYRDKLNIGIKTAVVLGYQLNPQLSLQGRISYRDYLKNINDESYDINTTFNLVRMEIGIRQTF